MGYGIEGVVPEQEACGVPTTEDRRGNTARSADLRDLGAVLVDVREGDERSAGYAPEAVHVPLAEVGDAVSRFDGLQVLAVCRSGGRSAKAAETLAAAGVDVRNVAGGM